MPIWNAFQRLRFLILIAMGIQFPACTPRLITLTRSQLMMGHVPVNISIRIPPQEKERALAASEETYRLGRKTESLISEFQPGSEISCLNQTAGKNPCPISPETLELLQKSLEIGTLTDHAFDIRFSSPSAAGRRGKISIDPKRSEAALIHPQTRIGVSSIGKGFIVDRMVEFLRQQGFANVLIDAGGDLRALGGPWQVAIQIPGGNPGDTTSEQTLSDRAMGSSGLYEQGHHIIDPRTGEKIDRQGGITVLAKNLATASALGTGFFVLGEKKFLNYLPRFPGIKVYWIDPDGKTRTYPMK